MRKNIIVIFLSLRILLRGISPNRKLWGSIFMALFFLALSNCQAETIEFLIENSPYYVQKDLLIKEGETFTVEPGVVIEMAKDTSIIIEGRIDIAGYPKGGEVIFKAVGPFQNYNKGFWKAIIIKSKEKNVINYCVIQHAKTGIEVSRDSSADITNNIITQNKTGIKAEGVKVLSIAQNSFLGNFSDIELTGTTGLITRNFFQGSLVGIRLNDAYPKIENNYFKQIHKYAVVSGNRKDIQLGENWWGCAEIEKIKGLISLEGKGKINFEPF